MKKIIFYELNEVPEKILRIFAQQNPNSAVSQILKKGAFYETKTTDTGHLSPWITWPTLHRGINNLEHCISDLGQNLTGINQRFPNYFDLLANNGLDVGVFGSLHTYPLPENYQDYSFYIPDTFASSPDTYPQMYQSFQSLNLSMVNKNGRNVHRNVPFRDALSFLFKAPALGITANTVGKILNQLAKETTNKDMVVRRRTTQSQLSFDLFYKLLRKKTPALSTFFTNHVASSMHRYWPATFPKDYADFCMPDAWNNRFKHEIWYTMQEADQHLSKLLRFIHSNNDFMLIVASSMGQAAVEESYRVQNQLYLKHPEKLMRWLGINKKQWKQHLAMEPCYVFNFVSAEITKKFLDFIHSLTVKGGKVGCSDLGANSVRIAFGQVNFDRAKDVVTAHGKSITLEDLGLEVVPIQDESGSYAYHIPEGVLLTYSNDPPPAQNEHTIPTTSIAPSILQHFECAIPDYMGKPVVTF
ncbi:MAG: hypothetical protein NXI01_02745 [Gammaproteobacteria bacterium]|nr:hypothetical protein [Gammaproteobacteria bacterium]